MKTKPTFDELKDCVSKLHSLLQDPQPGLMTWHEFVNKKLQFISDAYNFDESNDTVTIPGCRIDEINHLIVYHQEIIKGIAVCDYEKMTLAGHNLGKTVEKKKQRMNVLRKLRDETWPK